jgi:hypothetical protein
VAVEVFMAGIRTFHDVMESIFEPTFIFAGLIFFIASSSCHEQVGEKGLRVSFYPNVSSFRL